MDRLVPGDRDGRRAFVVMYANPDMYPPTINAINILRREYTVHVFVRRHGAEDYPWPSDVILHRLGTPGALSDKLVESAWSKFREYTAFLMEVRRNIRVQGPDLVYAYEPHGFLSALAASNTHGVLVYHRHEVEDIDSLPISSLQTWIMRLAMRFTRRADVVVFPERRRSEYYLAHARDPRACIIVPNVPSRKAFESGPELDAYIDARWQTREILFRGYLDPANGNLEPLLALPLLQFPSPLRFIGPVSSAFQRTLEETARTLGVASRVFIDGYAPYLQANLRTMSAGCGIALHHPVSMNLRFLGSASNKIFEYAACGLPVVVPDREAYRDFFSAEQWVVFCDPADPSSIAAAVNRIFTDAHGYRAMCHAAREAFETRFHYEIVFQPVLDRIRELLARKGGGSTPPPRSDSA